MKLFGTTFLATRICLFFTSLGIGLLMYFLSRRICRLYATLPCVLLAGTYFGGLWPTISHHVDSNCVALASVACCILWMETRRSSFLFAAGVMAGVTTCILQPKGILLLLSLLLWLWTQHRRSLISKLEPALLTVGYFGVVVLTLFYFWWHGALRDILDANLVWPFKNYGVVNSVPYAQGLITRLWGTWTFAKHGFGIGIGALLMVPFVLIAALPAVLPILGSWCRRNSTRPEVTLYWFCGSALWLSEIHRKDIVHLIFGSALLIILCVFYLGEIQSKGSVLALQIIAIGATCLAVANLVIALLAHPMATSVGSVAVSQPDALLSQLEQKTAPGDEIFAYPYCPMYYFLSATTNPTRYSILIYGYNSPPQFDEVVRVLEQRHVKYIVWNAIYRDGASRSFVPTAKSSGTDSLIIEPYLEAHYRIVWADEGTRLLERKIDRGGN